MSLKTLVSPIEFETVMGLYKFVNMHPLVNPTSQQPKLKKRSWRNKLLELMNVLKLELSMMIQEIKRYCKWIATLHTVGRSPCVKSRNTT